MPNNYIIISQAAQLGISLQQTINVTSQMFARLQQLKLDMDNMTDGVTFTTLEAAFGLPAGKGTLVYNLMAGTIADLNASSNFMNLQAWLGAIR